MSVQEIIDEISNLNMTEKFEILEYFINNDEELYYQTITKETNIAINDYKKGLVEPLTVSEFMDNIEMELN